MSWTKAHLQLFDADCMVCPSSTQQTTSHKTFCRTEYVCILQFVPISWPLSKVRNHILQWVCIGVLNLLNHQWNHIVIFSTNDVEKNKYLWMKKNFLDKKDSIIHSSLPNKSRDMTDYTTTQFRESTMSTRSFGQDLILFHLNSINNR